MINCIQHRRLCLRSVCRKSMFFQKSACSQSLSPLGHSVGFASCKAWCVLISASLPKTPFPGERLCLLCWLCIVQEPLGIHARHPCRAECGATAPRPSKDACSQPHKATMQGRIMTATQSRCTMQRHKWLSMHRCSGTNG